jgi:hypothetical protein
MEAGLLLRIGAGLLIVGAVSWVLWRVLRPGSGERGREGKPHIQPPAPPEED